jgi:Arc/MetJ family transcription regulator
MRFAMRTHIEIDGEMLAKVMKFMGTSTNRETIDRLLRDKLRQAERIKRSDCSNDFHFVKL